MDTQAPEDTTCGERIGASVTYPCSLPKGHPGPHMAREVRVSVVQRERWEADHRHAASGLGEFQGRAETTAERYTENPAPRPGEGDEAPTPTSPLIVATPSSGAQAKEIAQQAASSESERLGFIKGRAQSLNNLLSGQMRDGLEVLYADDKIVLKALPDGRYMMENPEGTIGQAVEPTFIEVEEYPSTDEVGPVGLKQHNPETGETYDPDAPVGEGFVGFLPLVEAPTKQREGDQMLPKVNGLRDAQSQAIEDIQARRDVGIRRYGTALQPFNGRNVLLDLYEESLDFTIYLRQMLTMREASRDVLVEQVQEVLVDRLTEDYAPELAERIVDRILDAFTGSEPTR